MESKRFLFSLLVVVLISATTSAATRVGGYKRIKDPKIPYVVEIAKFAVSEHNKNASKSKQLALVAVVSGQKQVVAGINHKLDISVVGTNYKLYISAKVDDHHNDKHVPIVKVYEAVVYDKPSKHRSLTLFKELKKKN